MTVAPASGSGIRTIALVIADDHAMVRSGLRLLLERCADLCVVAVAGDVDTALDEVGAKRPDVLLLDLGMPGSVSSLAAIGKVREAWPSTRVLVLTMQSDPLFARAALRAGAAGYLVKDVDEGVLVAAVRSVAAGGRYVDPALGAFLASAESTGAPDLTSRELDVLRLAALGHTNVEIAAALALSVRTIESHRARIQRKLGHPTRAQLVRFAIDRGMVSPGAQR
jgi:two-component system response regulator NreC